MPLLFSAQQATAQEKNFGLGWSTYHPHYDDSGNRVHFHMDYLWYSFDVIRSEEQFTFHYGNGGRFIDLGEENGSLAVHVVLVV